MSICPNCKEFVFSLSMHKCDPVYRIYQTEDGPEDDPEDMLSVRATCPEDAALKACEKYHADWDYPKEIHLTVIADGEHHKFYISVSTVPVFDVSEDDL